MKIKIGTTVGNWIVKSEKFKEDGIYWNKCECICGLNRNVRTWHLNNSKTKGCGCTNTKGRFRYEGIGDLSKAYLTSFKASRKSKDIVFDKQITLEYLWELFVKQSKKCALSGVDINLNPQWSSQNNGKKKHLIQTASLDRIDNSKGYEIGNVQWVHKDVNFMRGSLNISDFIFMCKKVSENNLEYNTNENNFNGKRLYFGKNK